MGSVRWFTPIVELALEVLADAPPSHGVDAAVWLLEAGRIEAALALLRRVPGPEAEAALAVFENLEEPGMRAKPGA